MEAKERIKVAYNYLRNHGIVHTQQDVANVMDVKKENISRAFNGNEKYLTPGFMERFNNAFNNIFNKAWLLTGEGEMLNNKAENEKNKPIADEQYLLVPIIHIDSVGGMHSTNTIAQEPQYIEGYVPFTDAREGDICIIQSGDSMTPTCPSGSLLLIRRVENWRQYLGYGNIFVIELSDGRRITKEVTRYEENPEEYVWCISHNPDVPDEELPKSMIVSVWKVIKIQINKGW